MGEGVCGVVHAYVDQKLLKSNKIKSFIRGPKIGSRHCSSNTNALGLPFRHMLLCQVDPPNTIYTHLSQALLFQLICHTRIKNRGLSVDP